MFLNLFFGGIWFFCLFVSLGFLSNFPTNKIHFWLSFVFPFEFIFRRNLVLIWFFYLFVWGFFPIFQVIREIFVLVLVLNLFLEEFGLNFFLFIRSLGGFFPISNFLFKICMAKTSDCWGRLGKGAFTNYVDKNLPIIDHLPTPCWHLWGNSFTEIRETLHTVTNSTFPVPPTYLVLST